MYEHKDNCIPNNIANPDIRYIEGRPGPQGPKGADGVVTFDSLKDVYLCHQSQKNIMKAIT